MRLFSSFCAYAGKQNSATIAINEKIFFIILLLSKPSLVQGPGKNAIGPR
jgi:hypothetical protein